MKNNCSFNVSLTQILFTIIRSVSYTNIFIVVVQMPMNNLSNRIVWILIIIWIYIYASTLMHFDPEFFKFAVYKFFFLFSFLYIIQPLNWPSVLNDPHIISENLSCIWYACVKGNINCDETQDWTGSIAMSRFTNYMYEIWSLNTHQSFCVCVCVYIYLRENSRLVFNMYNKRSKKLKKIKKNILNAALQIPCIIS